MLAGRKVVVVMPAYNAAASLRRTHDEVLAQQIVDEVIVVDDASQDETVSLARTLPQTRVYVHPDYQYTPKLIPAMAALIGGGLYHCVLGSRILGGYALRGGMPWWRYVGNRFLTLVENMFIGAKLSEYHTGYRAFSSELLRKLPLDANSDDFVFDNQVLAQVVWLGYAVAEVSCPTRYAPEASSINFRGSVRYGFGCLATALTFRLAKAGLIDSALLPR